MSSKTIKINDASGNSIDGFIFGTDARKEASVVFCPIPAITGSAQKEPGWYRFATVKPYDGYVRLFIICNGKFNSAKPSNFAAHVSIGGTKTSANQHTSINVVDAQGGGTFDQLRVSHDTTNEYYLELYQNYTGTGSVGRHQILVMAVGGAVLAKFPTEAISSEPSTIDMTAFIGSPIGVKTVKIPNWGTSAGQIYMVFARFLKHTSSTGSSMMLISGLSAVNHLNRGSGIIEMYSNNQNGASFACTKLSPVYGTVTFGYYDGGDGYIYLGKKASAGYSSGPHVMELFRSGIYSAEFGNFYQGATEPEGWTVIDTWQG